MWRWHILLVSVCIDVAVCDGVLSREWFLLLGFVLYIERLEDYFSSLD
jgi:hypothetical protein